MKILSEKTRKFYDTVEQCQEAEAAWDAEQAAKEAERKALAEVRKERAKEVEDAYIKAREAEKDFIKLRNAFVKDFGSFHMTIREQNAPPSFFDDIVKMLF
jgi:hypothetical protein